ncbi:MAG: hypothetical protein GQ470_06855 [Gammaproteobacteria bacterium]|nr:hypothetical protein [Gammaproteobacteria bacterium]
MGSWLRLLFAVASLSLCSMLQADELYRYTPSDVYTEALRIKGDINIIRSHFNAATVENPLPVKTSLKPRNAWQKAYEIMVKINILREKYGLPRMEEVQVEPLTNLDPGLTHGQVLRILTELDIFMIRIGISSRTPKAKQQAKKTPADVYNLLNVISTQLDAINGESFVPSHVFAQTMRVLDDLNLIIARLNVYERIGPPKKDTNAQPQDVYQIALELMDEIHRLQMIASVEPVDFRLFKVGTVTPADVFDLTQMLLAEIQPIKAYLRISRVTIPSQNYRGKTPGDAKQALEWGIRISSRIQSLDY